MPSKLSSNSQKKLIEGAATPASGSCVYLTRSSNAWIKISQVELPSKNIIDTSLIVTIERIGGDGPTELKNIGPGVL